MALEAALEDAGDWDQLWFLGDLVGYGPDPNECVDRLRELAPAVALSGNHDWAVLNKLDVEEFNRDARWAVNWTRKVLKAENRAYLEGLQPMETASCFTLAHGSPRYPVWEYLTDVQTARMNFGRFATPYCLVGHSHVPLLFRLDEETADPELALLSDGDVLALDGRRLIINPGSVGQPRDGDPRAAYALLDSEKMSWEARRVHYDIEETQRRMRGHKMPLRLIERLEYGL